ncbi:MAG: hypothetical protein NUV68_04635 [Caldiserica bacterium]|jgi:hypothetical protein|nr:hypothetical protein [Caldisericota bacterium]MDH7562622.1 hypothetical protein [Caldisericota bacterium]
MNFNEKHVRLFYRLLNHRYQTELRFLKRGFYPISKIVKDEEGFVEVCRAWNGKRNIYALIRDRAPETKKCARASDIIGLQTVVLDLDPIRETDSPSSGEELERSIEIALEISAWFEKQGFKKPYQAVTGNGTCLYFSLPFLEVTPENREKVSSALQLFEEKMRKILKRSLNEKGCRIDSMYDLPRVGKVIGTLSVKGEESPGRPWRCSYWMEEPLERRVDEKLLQFLLELKGNTVSQPSIREEAEKVNTKIFRPVWLMQPIPYFGEKLSGDWIWEPKIDGWRMQIIVKEEGVEFWGRRLERKPNWTEKLKAVPRSGLSNVPPGTILDCELYCDQGRRFIPSLFTANPRGKPMVLIFDIIFFKGEFLGNLPLCRRKEILSHLGLKEPFYFVWGEKVIDLESHLREAVQKGNEGIVVKEVNSPYLLGKDAPMATANWRKIKPR